MWEHRVPRGEKKVSPYQIEHNELYRHIKEDIPINNAYYGAKSSFTSTLGRLATYSGQEVKWDEAVESNFSIMPENYAMDAEAPVQPDDKGDYYVAIPGEYKLPWKA